MFLCQGPQSYCFFNYITLDMKTGQKVNCIYLYSSLSNYILIRAVGKIVCTILYDPIVELYES